MNLPLYIWNGVPFHIYKDLNFCGTPFNISLTIVNEFQLPKNADYRSDIAFILGIADFL